MAKLTSAKSKKKKIRKNKKISSLKKPSIKKNIATKKKTVTKKKLTKKKKSATNKKIISKKKITPKKKISSKKKITPKKNKGTATKKYTSKKRTISAKKLLAAQKNKVGEFSRKIKLTPNKEPDLSTIHDNDDILSERYSRFVEQKKIENAAPKITKSPHLSEKDLAFAAGDKIVYPTHGVGKIISIITNKIAGLDFQLYIVEFNKDKMTLQIPTANIKSSGMRKLSSKEEMESALKILKGRARVKRTMWSRRAQEYESKINSGDPNAISEVVRDLHRNTNQPEQSYSERQIFESALERLVREVAAIDDTNEIEATEKIFTYLKKTEKIIEADTENLTTT